MLDEKHFFFWTIDKQKYTKVYKHSTNKYSIHNNASVNYQKARSKKSQFWMQQLN